MEQLTNSELLAIINMLGSYRPGWGSERNEAVYSAESKIRDEYYLRMRAAAEARPRRKRGEGKAIVDNLKVAASKQLKVSMKYVSSAGDISERIIHPLDFTDAARSRMLRAWCEKRGEKRTFRTDRIASLTVLNQRFTPPPRSPW